VAVLCDGRQKRYLGLHDDEEEAARVYDKEAKKLFVNPVLNFLPDGSLNPDRRKKVSKPFTRRRGGSHGGDDDDEEEDSSGSSRSDEDSGGSSDDDEEEEAAARAKAPVSSFRGRKECQGHVDGAGRSIAMVDPSRC
jgi:hypothetical protein